MYFNLKNLIFVVVLLLHGSGCSLQHQLRSYVQYYFHDLEIKQDKIYILLGKERYSPNVSISAAMMNEMSTGTSYSLLSYGLLSFDIRKFETSSTSNIDLYDKKNLITQKTIKEANPHVREKIVDSNRLLFSYDIYNIKPCVSLILLNDNINVEHITCMQDIIPIGLSFDRSVYSYTRENQIFIYDIDEQSTRELRPKDLQENFSEQFESTNYIISNNWFIDLSLTGNKLTPYKLDIINKETSQIAGSIISKFRIVKDLDLSLGLVLAYRSSLGFEIFDLEGNSLYSLGRERSEGISRAVLHEDKVYAAGITTRDTPLGKKEYIEIIQWDYKNDSVIKKYYPCDSPELEM